MCFDCVRFTLCAVMVSISREYHSATLTTTMLLDGFIPKSPELPCDRQPLCWPHALQPRLFSSPILRRGACLSVQETALALLPVWCVSTAYLVGTWRKPWFFITALAVQCAREWHLSDTQAISKVLVLSAAGLAPVPTPEATI